MLAKELKIQNVIKQRVFIEEQLKKIANFNEDGDVSFLYIGQVYPENRFYFEEEGFSVTRIDDPEFLVNTKVLPVYVFTISNTVNLSADEIAQAEAIDASSEDYEVEEEDDNESSHSQGSIPGISLPGLTLLFPCMSREENQYHDEDEELSGTEDDVGEILSTEE